MQLCLKNIQRVSLYRRKAILRCNPCTRNICIIKYTKIIADISFFFIQLAGLKFKTNKLLVKNNFRVHSVFFLSQIFHLLNIETSTWTTRKYCQYLSCEHSQLGPYQSSHFVHITRFEDWFLDGKFKVKFLTF